jgi:hypothetical protein
MRELPEKVAEVFAWIEVEERPMFPMYLRECMERADIEDHDVLYGEFIHAGYRLPYNEFIAECNAEGDTFSLKFARGVMDVLGLDGEERQAFAAAIACGSAAKSEL